MDNKGKNTYRGISAALLSAVLFGVTPILAKLSYSGGNNGITLTFLRSAFALPILWGILRYKGISLSITKSEIKALLLSGVLGTAATTLLLYSSYNYIEVGMATALHFLYPVIIMAVGILFFSEKPSIPGMSALVLGIGGVFFLVDFSGSQNMFGIIIAIVSAVNYAIYMLTLQHSPLQKMPYIKLGFYYAFVNSMVSGLYGIFTRQLTFELTPQAWMISFAIAILVAILAVILLNYSIVKIGASTASMLSVLEPICGVLCGVIILGEIMTLKKGFGFVLVILSVVFASIAENKKNHS